MAIDLVNDMEAAAAASHAETDANDKDMTRRFWVGLALSTPVFILARREMMGARYFEEARFEGNYLIEMVLSGVVVFWAGRPILERARSSLALRRPNMFTLIGMGVLAAYLFSVASFALAPRISRHTIEPIPVLFDSAAFIALLALLWQMLEARARSFLRQPEWPGGDAVPAWFVPGVVGVAVLTFALWLWLGSSPSLADAPEKAAARALSNAVAVLIVACPCALGLATTMPIQTGVSRGAQEGVLVRKAGVLEKLAMVDTLVLPDSATTTDAAAMRRLQEMGVNIVVLTGGVGPSGQGEARSPAGYGRAQTGHQQKMEEVRRQCNSRRLVAMAGDSINDAPALAAAHVGIAMGTEANAAKECADITLVQGDLQGVVKAMELSRQVMRNIRQNLFFAVVYNAAGIPIAAGMLHPFFRIQINPMLAGVAMILSSSCVALNALRLRKQ